MTMQFIPVLDLLRGQVVRGVAGQRQNYRPIVSLLTSSSLPLEVARAFQNHFRLSLLYVADLDAISGSPPALETYELLRNNGFRLWVDAGLQQAKNAEPLLQAGVEGIIAGLETLTGPEELARLCRDIGPERIIFSLDLKDGKPLTPGSDWPLAEAPAIAEKAIELGVRRIIVLDLSRVGMGNGTTTGELCRRLHRTYPEVELITGGGVRDVADLRRLAECGVRGVLLASALHDGRLTAEDLRTL